MPNERNKEIQTIRMMVYFIDATSDIIQQEGIDKITIRKIADLAGYNSATIYNYFDELSHLIFFGSMRYIKKYINALPGYLAACNTPLEKYLKMWECFCTYSFEEPEIYHAVFSSNLGCPPEQLLSDYYGMFPTDLIEAPEDLHTMLQESNLAKRGRIALNECVDEGYLQADDAERLSEMQFLMWQGMHTMFLNKRSDYSVAEVVDVTMDHIRFSLESSTFK
ncbi:TetR/AcrR family transcriptional regulator [Salsuginibacillus kocurii]|uniref:TetR/AcrR family transcriptional regulator n=1 Tax=Salsuginibacillus kocurii TaxID=427078 RepID=UPI00036CB044|nr:TetR/AcrR family transcriptional regulator [Salsuginibacillus kocurii]